MAKNDISGAVNAIDITPSDATVLSFVRGLYIGGTGDVAVTMKGGGSVTYEAVPAGTFMPIHVTKVLATGTTATAILGLL